MRIKAIVTVAIACLGVGVIAPANGDTRTFDHLVPVEAESDQLQKRYRAYWQRRILVTRGEVARFVSLPGLAGTETAISIYQVRRTGASRQYAITATQAQESLWSYFTPGTQKASRRDDVPIVRVDAAMPESLAKVVHEVWIAMLRRVKPADPHVISLDSTSELFSATDAYGRKLSGRIPAEFGPNTRRLFQITGLLQEYVDGRPEARPRVAKDIEREAATLLSSLGEC